MGGTFSIEQEILNFEIQLLYSLILKVNIVKPSKTHQLLLKISIISASAFLLLFSWMIYWILDNDQLLKLKRWVGVEIVMEGEKWHTQPFKNATEIINGRNYKTIYLTGDVKSDRQKIEAEENSMNQIILTNDFKNGLHFHISDSVKYEQLVQLSDNLYISKSKYLFAGNDLWIFNYPKQVYKYERHRVPPL